MQHRVSSGAAGVVPASRRPQWRQKLASDLTGFRGLGLFFGLGLGFRVWDLGFGGLGLFGVSG